MSPQPINKSQSLRAFTAFSIALELRFRLKGEHRGPDVTLYKPPHAKDSAQLASELRRNARRELRSYTQECRDKWPSLSEEEKELCREALRNLARRASFL